MPGRMERKGSSNAAHGADEFDLLRARCRCPGVAGTAARLVSPRRAPHLNRRTRRHDDGTDSGGSKETDTGAERGRGRLGYAAFLSRRHGP